jgi:hypothetical protein
LIRRAGVEGGAYKNRIRVIVGAVDGEPVRVDWTVVEPMAATTTNGDGRLENGSLTEYESSSTNCDVAGGNLYFDDID